MAPLKLAELLEAELKSQLSGGPMNLPEAGRWLWDVFADLTYTRTYSGAPNPISYGEIDAYCRLMQLPLEPRHVQIIRRLDAQWLEWAKGAAQSGSSGTLPRRSGNLSPELFDVAIAHRVERG